MNSKVAEIEYFQLDQGNALTKITKPGFFVHVKFLVYRIELAGATSLRIVVFNGQHRATDDTLSTLWKAPHRLLAAGSALRGGVLEWFSESLLLYGHEGLTDDEVVQVESFFQQ